MVKKTLKVENELGIHARPAAKLVTLANKFRSRISLDKDGQKANGKSILDVMTLAADKGSVITLIAMGEDEKEAIEALSQLFKEKFGEE